MVPSSGFSLGEAGGAEDGAILVALPASISEPLKNKSL